MLTLAIQKSGRLSENSLQLLKDCGIYLQSGNTTKLKSKATNFPLEILKMRDDDIPECINDSIADIGIIGENEFLEKKKELKIVERLGYSKCHISIAVPKDMKYKSIQDLSNKSIATSYPNILKKFLKKNNINANLRIISGSVEIAPSIGLADAVFDIVSSGSTLISNGLKEVEIVMNSEAILIANPKLDEEKLQLLEKLLFRIRAVNKARNRKYILLNAPNESIEKICKLLPGMKSPTIMPLLKKDWSSLHSVIKEDEFWENIQKLKEYGAQGILVIPIEKMII